MLGEKKLYIQKNFFETISSEQDGSMVLHTHTHTHTPWKVREEEEGNENTIKAANYLNELPLYC
jgi:hypothetical protein